MMHAALVADTAIDSGKCRCPRGSWPGGALDSSAITLHSRCLAGLPACLPACLHTVEKHRTPAALVELAENGEVSSALHRQPSHPLLHADSMLLQASTSMHL